MRLSRIAVGRTLVAAAALFVAAALGGCDGGDDAPSHINLAFAQGTLVIRCARADCSVGAVHDGELAVAVTAVDGGDTAQVVERFTNVRRLRIITGDGNDRVTLDDVGFSTVEDLRIETGAGNDVVNLTDSGMKKDLVIQTGTGDDELHLDAGAGGRLLLDVGDGDDSMLFEGGGGGEPSRIDGGAGNDALTLGPLTFPSGVVIDAGDGDDRVDMSGSRHSGTFTVDGGSGTDDLDVRGTTFDGSSDIAGFEREDR